MYHTKIHRKLDQVLAMVPQAENDSKKEKQILVVLRTFESQTEPKKPVEIANITGFPQASVRRIIRNLVHLEKVQKDSDNRYSIIK